MSKKNSKNNLLFIILFLVIVFSFGYLFRIYYSYQKTLGEVVEYGVFKKVDDIAIKNIGKLRSCGSWPVLIINNNPQRGNPFNKKETEAISVLSTENVECLPVNLR